MSRIYRLQNQQKFTISKSAVKQVPYSRATKQTAWQGVEMAMTPAFLTELTSSILSPVNLSCYRWKRAVIKHKENLNSIPTNLYRNFN